MQIISEWIRHVPLTRSRLANFYWKGLLPGRIHKSWIKTEVGKSQARIFRFCSYYELNNIAHEKIYRDFSTIIFFF